MEKSFCEHLAESPVIAILRHLSPSSAVAVGEALIEAGVTIMEVPLNGRDATAALKALASGLSGKALVGAGTVLKPEDVDLAKANGARFIFSPNVDCEVIGMSRRLGMASIPGAFTPTECFRALQQGATALKLFPAEMIAPNAVKAFRTVLPPEIPLILSGGISAANIKSYFDAGAKGFGCSGALFSQHLGPEEIGAKARQLVVALRRKNGDSCQ